jgi:hypothetical protein
MSLIYNWFLILRIASACIFSAWALLPACSDSSASFTAPLPSFHIFRFFHRPAAARPPAFSSSTSPPLATLPPLVRFHHTAVGSSTFSAFSAFFAASLTAFVFFALYCLHFAVFASLLTPNPTLSYTFLRFPTPPKPAPHQTFLHFPTLPTLLLFFTPGSLYIPTLIAFPLLRTKSVPSPYQVRSKAAPFSLQFRTVNARESYPHPTKTGTLVPP